MGGAPSGSSVGRMLEERYCPVNPQMCRCPSLCFSLRSLLLVMRDESRVGSWWFPLFTHQISRIYPLIDTGHFFSSRNCA